MDIQTQTQEKTLPTISPQSIMLAKQAQKEQALNGAVTVVCPKCQKHPKIETTSRGERTFVSCKCRYILDAELTCKSRL